MDTCGTCILNFWLNVLESGFYYMASVFKYYIFSPAVTVVLFLILWSCINHWNRYGQLLTQEPYSNLYSSMETRRSRLKYNVNSHLLLIFCLLLVLRKWRWMVPLKCQKLLSMLLCYPLIYNVYTSLWKCYIWTSYNFVLFYSVLFYRPMFLKLLASLDHYMGSQRSCRLLSYCNIPLSCRGRTISLLSVNRKEIAVNVAVNHIFCPPEVNVFNLWFIILFKFKLFYILHVIQYYMKYIMVWTIWWSVMYHQRCADHSLRFTLDQNCASLDKKNVFNYVRFEMCEMFKLYICIDTLIVKHFIVFIYLQIWVVSTLLLVSRLTAEICWKNS